MLPDSCHNVDKAVWRAVQREKAHFSPCNQYELRAQRARTAAAKAQGEDLLVGVVVQASNIEN